MSTVQEEPTVRIVSFTVEADHPQNCDLLLQSIPGCRLRGAIKATRTTKNAKTEQETIPIDRVQLLGLLPEIPGMRLKINPKSLEYVIDDPLFDNEDLCKLITQGLQSAGRIHDPKTQGVKGVPPQKEKLDVHRMKTLCREVRRLVDLGHMREHKNAVPELEQIDRMKGRYLLNPGSKIRTSQPRYEDMFDKFVTNLDRSGG